MPKRDIYRYINDLDDKTLDRIIDRLEFRRADPTFKSWIDDYLDQLDLSSARNVLTLGAGTGVEARTLASRADFSGRVTALDQSPKLLDAGRRFADDEGVGDRIEFRAGDAHDLDFESDHFDVVIAHTLISHVADPQAVVTEAARVLKSDGRMVIFDGDYASWTFGYSDEEFGKLMDETLIDTIVNNPRVLRTMPKTLSQAGLQSEYVSSTVFAEVGTGSFYLAAAETYAPIIAKSEAVPAERVDDWLEELQQSHAEGTFFAAGNYYTYIAGQA
jgi:ubiquinone/menaquinone biosynthesis C-methylase UbiE